MSGSQDISIILTEDDVQAKVDVLAERMAPRLTGEWSAIAILIGATMFTSDLMKALARHDVHPVLDALWLESYRDARESSGRVVVRADLQRQVKGRGAIIIDDVFDTGRTLEFAKAHLLAKGAREVLTCAFASKPWAPQGGVDYLAYEAPGRFLVGYGMDDAGKYRGLPFLGALD